MKKMKSEHRISPDFQNSSPSLSASRSLFLYISVLFYVPNLITYSRIVLAFVGWAFSFTRPKSSLFLWIIAAWLDLFDGYFARVLDQESRIGIFLDVIADIILRSVIWIAAAMSSVIWYSQRAFSSLPSEDFSSLSLQDNYHLLPFTILLVPLLCLVLIILEWMTMLSTQLLSYEKIIEQQRNNIHWKSQEHLAQDPLLVRYFFSNNFKNPLGTWGIYGLFAAPMVIFVCYQPSLLSYIHCDSLSLFTDAFPNFDGLFEDFKTFSSSPSMSLFIGLVLPRHCKAIWDIQSQHHCRTTLSCLGFKVFAILAFSGRALAVLIELYFVSLYLKSIIISDKETAHQDNRRER